MGMSEIDVEQLPADADPEEIARAYVNMWNTQKHSAIPDLVSETFIMLTPLFLRKESPVQKGRHTDEMASDNSWN